LRTLARVLNGADGVDLVVRVGFRVPIRKRVRLGCWPEQLLLLLLLLWILINVGLLLLLRNRLRLLLLLRVSLVDYAVLLRGCDRGQRLLDLLLDRQLVLLVLLIRDLVLLRQLSMAELLLLLLLLCRLVISLRLMQQV